MKKLTILFFAAALMLEANGQAEWRIFAGPQATTARYLIADKAQSTDYKFGFQAGVGLKMQWEGQLYFAPQAFYSMKGFKVKLSKPSFPPDSLAIDNDVVLHCFELAALLQYDLSAAPSHFFFRLGPSLDIQVYGKETFNRSSGDPVSRKMKFSYADYGRYGANIIAHAGYQSAGGLSVFAQYTLGIGSIVNTDNGPRVVHRAAGITVAYPLGRKK